MFGGAPAASRETAEVHDKWMGVVFNRLVCKLVLGLACKNRVLHEIPTGLGIFRKTLRRLAEIVTSHIFVRNSLTSIACEPCKWKSPRTHCMLQSCARPPRSC